MAHRQMASVSASKKKASKFPAGKVHRMHLEAVDGGVMAHAFRPPQESKDNPYPSDESDMPKPHTSLKSLHDHIDESFSHLFPAPKKGKAGGMGGSDKAGMGRQPDDSATQPDEV